MDSAARDTHQPPELDVITLREPRSAWLANLFWGALIAGVLLVPALLAEDGGWERTLSIVLGPLALGGFPVMALQTRARVVRCDASSISVLQPLAKQRIALSDVSSVTRKDLRQKLRQLREIGHPRSRPKQMDTMAQVVVYTLRDRRDRPLLVLSRDLEPKREMQRLLLRLQEQTGSAIRDE